MPDLTEVVPQTSELTEGPPQPNGQRPPSLMDRVLRFERSARKFVAVPEWDLTIWFRPLTLADLQEVEAKNPRDHLERMVVILCLKAEDEAGNRLFTSGDKFSLMREVPAQRIQRIVDQIVGVIYPTVDAAKEAIQSDPSSPSA